MIRARHSAPLLFSLFATACSTGPSSGDRVIVTSASPGDFLNQASGVEPVFERHCGSLDCHVDVARPLRIYGQYGLRRAAPEGGAAPGGGETTPEEKSSNYLSVISLEPEQMNAVTKGADPYSLLLLKKPLFIENHKGGKVLASGDDAEKCITGWLKGKWNDADHSVQQACAKGALYP